MTTVNAVKSILSPALWGVTDMATRVSANQGFTLLEVLIAIGITALIGLGAWSVLNLAIRTSEVTQVQLEAFGKLQKAVLFMSRDFQQLTPRAIRDEFGDRQAAVTTKGEFYLVEFSRVGWRNPMQDGRSDIQRVAYELNQGELIRHYWPVLDRAQDTTSVHRTLIPDIESIKIRFMNSSGGWLDEWPPESDSKPADPMFELNQIPRAIELKLSHKRFGEIRKLFDTGEYFANEAIASKNGAGQAPDGEEPSGEGEK